MFGFRLPSIKRFLLNQFLLGRLWLWLKPKLHGLLTFALVIFFIFYIHGEYLSYVEFSSDDRFIGTSFILKNVLMLIAIIVYLTFVFFIKKTRSDHVNPSVVKKEKLNKEKTETEKVENLDEKTETGKVENLNFLLDEIEETDKYEQILKDMGSSDEFNEFFNKEDKNKK
jgi:predicted membrane protein|tara:strand:+ start:662 stop:1171 length:510 start_codon:yes stop_codon:yes gene_type:complete